MNTDLLFLLPRILSRKYTPFLSPYWDEQELDFIEGRTHVVLPHKVLSSQIRQLFGSEFDSVLLHCGRAAIQMALTVMKSGSQNEVIMPSFACASLCASAEGAGCVPVFADTDKDFGLSCESVQQAYSERTLAIIVPHLSGLWTKDLDRIIDWAKSRQIWVIEDVAQALGLRNGHRMAGTVGDVGIFSSGIGKPLFCSGGGWLITRNQELKKRLTNVELSIEPAERVQSRIQKFIKRYDLQRGIPGLGQIESTLLSKVMKPQVDNEIYRMSEIEAGILTLQIPKLSTAIEYRRSHARKWRYLLDQSFASLRFLPEENNTATKMLVSFVGSTAQQDSVTLRRALVRGGIGVEQTYTPLHLRKAFRHYRRTDMSHCTKYSRYAFCIPARPNLTPTDWQRIREALSKYSGV